jgi:hypothetical protein
MEDSTISSDGVHQGRGEILEADIRSVLSQCLFLAQSGPYLL